MNTEAIYSNYRAVLRALRKADRGSGRTAARKQKALKLTADRYSIPMGQVKALVREQDQLNGITHPHPKPDLEAAAFEEVYAAAVAALGDAPCEVCLRSSLEEDVRPRLLHRLDSGELDMLRLKSHGVTAEPLSALPTVEDFHKLCFKCKAYMVGYSKEEDLTAAK